MKPLVFYFTLILTISAYASSNQPLSYQTYETNEANQYDVASIDKLRTDNKIIFSRNDKVYQNITDDVLWIWIDLSQTDKEKAYFTIANAYLNFGQLFCKLKNGEILSHPALSYDRFNPNNQVFYHYPTWKLNKLNDIDGLYIMLKGDSSRHRCLFYLYTEKEFLSANQFNYGYFSLFISLIFILSIVLLGFCLLKKEYRALIFIFYLVLMLIDFLCNYGLGIKYLWHDNLYLTNNIRSLSQTLAVLVIGSFYLKFYRIPYPLKKLKQGIEIIRIVCLVLVGFYLYKLFFGGLETLFLTVWIILKLCVVYYLILHIVLSRYKIIPKYLFLAFMSPIVFILTKLFFNPSLHQNWILFKIYDNGYYLSSFIEVTAYTYYIMQSVVKSEIQLKKIKHINKTLQESFDSALKNTELETRKNITGQLHDVIGGYVEALKMGLRVSDQVKQEEVINQFYSDYRNMIQKLDEPIEESDFLLESIKNFCNKLNKVFDNIISVVSQAKQSVALNALESSYLYQICAELLTNALKHAEASQIFLEFYCEKNQLEIIIADDGKGFDIHNKHNGLGIKNLRAKTKAIQAYFDFKSSANKGTEYKIILNK